LRSSLLDKKGGITSCPECNNSRLIQDSERGELVCQNCGYVISSNIVDNGPEWRAFDQQQRDKLTRVGAPLTWAIHDRGMSTTIGYQTRGLSGAKLNPEAQARLYRLRKWQQRSKVSNSMDRNLSNALNEMIKISQRLNLPKNVVETGSMIYRQAVQKHLTRGRNIQSVAVASIYMACRQCGVVRTLSDISESLDITKKEAAKNYRFLLRELKPNVPKADIELYISRIVNKLALTGDTERVAMMILNQVSEMKLTGGRGPSGIAAACIYISSQLTDDTRTQGEIAREAQVTEVTIRNRYKEIVNLVDFSIHI
jgi:transcription initiation factor TFIIB